MQTYRITNSKSGMDLGTFQAKDQQGALEAFAREAGYSTYAEACEEHPVAEGEMVVTEVEDASISDEQIEALRRDAGEAGDLEMVAICDRALEGDEAAQARCAEAISDARAMDDGDDEAASA